MTDIPAPPTNPKAYPARSRKREPLAAETVAQLRGHAERTGVGAMRLLRGAKDKPAGLTSNVIAHWLRGAAQYANPVHVAYVMERWAALPTNKRLAFTSEMRAHLAAEFLRTGSGPVPLLKRASDMPSGLTHQMLQSWLHGEPGTVGEAFWDHVTGCLRALPDDPRKQPRRGRPKGESHDKIDEIELAELQHHRKRTGIGPTMLLRRAADKPAMLTPPMVSQWLNGVTERADPKLVAYVLARYRAWP
ncbi:hypothetical protein NT2_13_00790 [Caenibius tardaugens NBRC 16725]|uniref:Uncharacterized protein n=1 Tax=Caenibius tardaugens NBRC 16725 TaxID=1219035 RepID=U2YQM0_9SPHN|nr:hypothetical protein [Caenibius tardaugens]AZI37880.1 hypothetical protein EGO55_19515 [Caenibius tardaugens NBRC 16725]GAD50992.1 hypothetical protein NT2_13_00790 [Caenibius tardaugens NBRC 16725]